MNNLFSERKQRQVLIIIIVVGRCIRVIKRGAEYALARTPLAKRMYWRYAPRYYRWKIRQRTTHNLPLDPLQTVWVDPDCIERYSGRENAYIDRYQDIGKIKLGNWDIYKSGNRSSKRIEDTTRYQSFVERFENGVEWEDTQIFSDLLFKKLEDDKNKKKVASKITDELREYDLLYEKIDSGEYKTQIQLYEKHGMPKNRVGFLELLTDEITVDIGRDGELLFVDGRHRLCMSKISKIDKIPVLVLCRHKEWLSKLSEYYYSHNNTIQDHPDIAQLSNKNSM